MGLGGVHRYYAILAIVKKGKRSAIPDQRIRHNEFEALCCRGQSASQKQGYFLRTGIRRTWPCFFFYRQRFQTMTHKFSIDLKALDNQSALTDQFNQVIALAETQGINGLLHVLACEACLNKYGEGEMTIYDVTDTCPKCAVTQFLVWKMLHLYEVINKARKRGGAIEDTTKARANSPMEALERGLSEWYSRDVLDCGHKGWVRLEDGQCSTCYARDVIARRKEQATSKPAAVAAAPAVVSLTAEQIADARAQEEAAKKKAANERQKRSRANRRKQAQIAKATEGGAR